MESVTEKPFPSINVLIADDDRVTCYLLTVLLKQKNISASYVYNLQDVTAAFKKQQYDILFLDNYLPDGFGIDFIERAKRMNPALKIVIITAEDTFNDIEIAFEKGAEYYLPKPFTKEGINHIFEHVIPECLSEKAHALQIDRTINEC
jgi:DNA-binding response OmpR family regulator